MRRAALLLLLLVISPRPVLPQTGLEVIDFLPSPASPQRTRAVLAEALESDDPVRLVEPDPALLRTVQWTIPDPARANCYDAGRRPRTEAQRIDAAAKSPNLTLSTLLQEGRDQILAQEAGEALDTLRKARSALPCSEGYLPREQIRAMFLHEGVAHFLLKDGQAEEVFLDVLGVDSESGFDVGGYPVAVRKEFQRVARLLPKRRMVPVINDLRDVEVYFDGKPFPESDAVYPGRHVLQIKGPGDSIRTALVTVPKTGPVELASLTDFGLFPLLKVRDVLLQDLRAGQLDRYHAAGLERYAQASNRRSMLFLVSLSDEGSPLRVYETGRGLVPLEDYLRRTSGTVSRSSQRAFREQGPSIGLSFTGSMLRSDASTFVENNRPLGATLRFEAPVWRLSVAARASVFPYKTRPVTDPGVCGDGSGCANAKASILAGAGVGLPIYLTPNLRVVPALFGEAAWMPELMLPTDSVNGAPLLADVLAAGPVGRVGAGYLVLERPWLVEARLDLSGGVLFAPTEAEAMRIVTLEASLGAGVAF